jgi:2-amino-4-hydroxy-6-hydroxymethyldihydropteridine diphosphokinase
MSGFIYKKIDSSKAIIKSRLFPLRVDRECKNVIVIGVGGNLGDSKRRFIKLIFKLRRDGLIKPLSTSIIFKNPPFGYLNQPDFYNTLILASTSLSPKESLRYLQRVENHFRREREFKNSPRTLDLDIIFYNKRVIESQFLRVPHYDWQNRESILLPLKYLKGRRCLKRVLSPLIQKRLMS